MEDTFFYSVVVPTYNSKDTISRSLNSILAQITSAEFEVILADDASTDGTAEYVLEHFNDPRVKILRSEVNQGPGAMRNKGIKAARGKYVAFLDADDEWEPYHLEAAYSALKPNLNVLFYFSNGTAFLELEDGRLDCIGEYGAIGLDFNRFSKQERYTRMYLANFIPTQGVIIQKDFLGELQGFDESLRSAQDHDLWLRALAICLEKEFVCNPTCTFKYYVRQGTVTANFKRRLKCQRKLLLKNRSDLQAVLMKEQGLRSVLMYYGMLLKSLSGIYKTAAWDVQKRQGKTLLAFVLRLIAFIHYPLPDGIGKILKSERGFLK